MQSAVDIGSQVRTGRLRAVDVVASALAAAKRSQDSLNAFTLIDEQGAMARARGLDKIVEQGKDPGPLAGVPVALKDIIDQAGLPNTRGGSFPVEPSAHSATVVRRLGAAGAVVIGRTNLHEFAFGFTSENHWFGPVRNPWNLATSPGGSSGGSAACVAAGIAPIAIGTDTGGSVRVPAALCGVFGLKVTHGRIPLTGVYPLAESFDTVGPFARNVEDLAATYTAMAGDDSKDPWSVPASVEMPESSFNRSEVHIGVVTQWFDEPHTKHIGHEIDQFVRNCADSGFDVRIIDDEALRPIPELTPASRAEILSVHSERLRQDPDRYGPNVRSRLTEFAEIDARHVVEATRWRVRARSVVKRLQSEGFTALVAPTVGVQHKSIGIDEVDIDGSSAFYRGPLSSFTSPINAIGIPSLAMPITNSGTPPVSVQLIGPAWSEAKLLTTARWLETKGLVGFTPPPIQFGEKRDKERISE